MERTMKAIADHGARFVGCNVMYSKGGTRDHFIEWLEGDIRTRRRLSRLYAGSTPPRLIARKSWPFNALREKYGLSRREDQAIASGSAERRAAGRRFDT
jgi:hypothetical protein